MNEQNRDPMEARLEALERENRNLKYVGMGAIAGALFLILLVHCEVPSIPRSVPPPSVPAPPSVPDHFGKLWISELEAGRIVVPGKIAGSSVVLGQTQVGAPIIQFSDREKRRMTLSLGEDGSPSFLLFDALDALRLNMDLSIGGEPHFSLQNAESKPMVTLPTKVPSDNLGRIRKTGKIERNLPLLMALGDPDRRFIH